MKKHVFMPKPGRHVLISILAVFCILSSIFLSACEQPQSSESTTGSGDVSEAVTAKSSYTVVTSFYPIYLSVLNIVNGVDSTRVVNMTTAQTGCLHDYQLKPQDLESLATADAFVINGAGMESFLSDVVRQNPALNVIDASKGIELLKDANGEANPHVWAGITNTISQVRNITDALILMDPKNAIMYKKNSSLYLSKLNALRTKATQELSTLKSRGIITFHEAFPYFAKEFNLTILAVIEREPDTSPTAKELEETIRIVKESKTNALFAEPQYSSKAAQMIADATGAKVFILDPVVTGESVPASINNYITTMEKNIETLKTALG